MVVSILIAIFISRSYVNQYVSILTPSRRGKSGFVSCFFFLNVVLL